MEPVAYFMKALKNYVGFEGRSRRREFWWFALGSFVIGVIAAIIDAALGTGGSGLQSGLVGTLASFALLLPSLAVGARRLHDIGRSGWWQLLIITIIGIIVLIVWWVQESHSEPNEHGSNPMLEPAPTM